MLFLIDENLPSSVGLIFANRGFEVEYVASSPELQGESDDVVFNYAIKQKTVVVTRDIGFASLFRFPLRLLSGIILIRFPNEISMQALCDEAARLTANLQETDFHHLIILEPGIIRMRRLETSK